MDDEEELVFESEGDALAEAAQLADGFPFQLARRRLDRAQDERAGEPDLVQCLSQQTRLERLEINRHVGKFRHDSFIINRMRTVRVLVTGWLLGGLMIVGLAAMAEYNESKARLLYDFVDQSDFFRGTAQADSRSLMNICFRAPTEELEEKFVKEASKRGLDGLKGHRLVGGMRASIYNAFPKAGCEALVAFISAESRGMPFNLPQQHPKEKEMYAVGEKAFHYRAGPFDFSCASCHGVDGQRIRLHDLGTGLRI